MAKKNPKSDDDESAERTEMVNVRVPKELMERFRRALHHTAPRRTQAQILRRCIRETVEKLEEKNKGKAFPPITDED
jgi:hypothetical protein